MTRDIILGFIVIIALVPFFYNPGEINLVFSTGIVTSIVGFLIGDRRDRVIARFGKKK